MSLDWKLKRLPAAVDAQLHSDLVAEYQARTTTAQYAAMTPAQQSAVSDAVIAACIESRARVTTCTPWRPWNHDTE